MLDTLKAKIEQAIDGGALTLDRSLLDELGLATALRAQLGAESLELRQVQLQSTGKTLAVSGLADALNIDAAKTTLSVTADGGAPKARLSLRPPANWRFEQSFPRLPKCKDFDRVPYADKPSYLNELSIRDARFDLTADKARPAGNLSFLATIDCDGPLAPVAPMLGATSGLALVGTVEGKGADRRLELSVPVKLNELFESFAPGETRLDIQSAPRYGIEGDEPGFALESQLKFGKKTVALAAAFSAGRADEDLCLDGRLEGFEPLGLAQIAKIFNLGDPASLLPPGFPTPPPVQAKGIRVVFDPASKRIASFALTIALAKPWELWPGKFGLPAGELTLRVIHPTESAKRRLVLECDGRLAVDKLTIPVHFASPQYVISGEREAAIDPAILLARFVPAAAGLKLPKIAALAYRIDPRAQSVFFMLALAPGYRLGIGAKTLTLDFLRVELNARLGTSAAASGRLLASAAFAGIRARLTAELARELRFALAIDAIDLREIGKNFLGLARDALPSIALRAVELRLDSSGNFDLNAKLDAELSMLAKSLGIDLPPGLTKVPFTDITLSFKAAGGAWSIALASTQRFAFPAGGASGLALSDVTLAFSGKRGARGARGAFACAFTLDGRLQLADELSLACKTLALNWESAKKKWTAKGSAQATLFGRAYKLDVEVSREKAETTFRFVYAKPITLGDFGGAGRISARGLTLSVERAAGESYRFGLSGETSAEVGGLLSARGELALAQEAGGARLSITAEAQKLPAIRLPIPTSPQPSLQLDLDKLVLARAPKAKSEIKAQVYSWSLNTGARARITGIPKILRQYLPDQLSGKLRIDDEGVALRFDVPKNLQPRFPELGFKFANGKTLSLGRPDVTIKRIELDVGDDPRLRLALRIGSLARLNYVFGTQANSSKPNVDFVNDAFDAELSIGRQLMLRPLSSPFKALKLYEKAGKLWSDWDFGDLGKFSFQTPEFSFNDGRWQASGGFESLRDPQLPLRPVKWVLRQANVPDAALAAVPDAVPLSGINLRDPNVRKQVERILGPKTLGRLDPKLSDALTQVLGAIFKAIKKLPPRLQEYLDLELPNKFSFDIDIETTGGGTSLALATGAKKPLRLLLPSLSPLPELVGFTLRKFSLGQKLGGALFVVEVDGQVDRFDIPSLFAVLILGVDGKNLSNRFILRDTLAIVPSAVPLPIPLFYSELGLEYRDLLGLQLQAHWYYPNPKPTPLDFLKLLKQLLDFFTKKNYLLHEHERPPNMSLDLTIGQNYLGLPEFLGGSKLGLTKALPTFDVYGSLARVFDALKTGNAGYVIEAVPLKVGKGAGATWIRVNDVKAQLGPIGLRAAWCITTEAEYTRDVLTDKAVTARLAQLKPNSILKALPTQANAPAYGKGFIVLLGGGWAIKGLTSFDVQLGMALTRAGGFATGFRLAGSIEKLMALELSGDLTVNPKDSFYRVHGYQSLMLFGAKIFALEADLTITDEFLRLAFDLQFGGRSTFAPQMILGKLPSGRTGLAIEIDWFDGASRQAFELGYRRGELVLTTELTIVNLPRVIRITGNADLKFSAKALPSFAIAGEAAIANGFLRGQAKASFDNGAFMLSIQGGIGGAGCTLTASGAIDALYAARFSVAIEFVPGFLNAVLNDVNSIVGAQTKSARQELDRAQKALAKNKKTLDGVVLNWQDFRKFYVRGCNTALKIMDAEFRKRSFVERTAARAPFDAAKRAVVTARDLASANWNKIRWQDLTAAINTALRATKFSFRVPNPSFTNPLRTRKVTVDFLGAAQRRALTSARNRISGFKGKIQFQVKASDAAGVALKAARSAVDRVEAIGTVKIYKLSIASELRAFGGAGMKMTAEVQALGRRNRWQLGFSTSPPELAKQIFSLAQR